MHLQKIIIAFLIAACTFCSTAQAQPNFSRSNFFDAVASENIKAYDQQLNSLIHVSGTDKQAFEGALLMRKAGAVKAPGQKLSLFKQGHKKLEAAIAQASANVEYRFLRLMVQENAPKMLGYHKEKKVDAQFIKVHFKELPKETQQRVLVYSKNSASLALAF